MILIKDLEKLKLKIIDSINPERIILFGSYAKDTFSNDSDLDLLVVIKESNEPRYKRARKIRKSIWGLVNIPKDILVYTEEELDRWKDVPMSFVSNIISEGKIIYEKE
jgi:predicted nucleotidyltransferase